MAERDLFGDLHVSEDKEDALDADEQVLAAGVDYNEEFMNMLEMVGWCGCAALMFVMFNTLILMGRVAWLPVPDAMFGWYTLALFGGFTLVTVSAGALRVYAGVNITYTRKIAHFFTFFLPFGLFALFPFQKSVTTYALTFCATFLMFVPLMHGIRNIPSMWLIRLAFASFDRREDRPLTLMWAVTQNLFVYLAMLPCTIILVEVIDAPVLILVPLVVTGLGDGFAEIVGRAVGRHKYRTNAMCARKLYTRSIEGSAMLVLAGIGAVVGVYLWGAFDARQLAAGLVAIPVPMAIAEAKSPHSWDNPFLLLVGGLLTIGVALIPRV